MAAVVPFLAELLVKLGLFFVSYAGLQAAANALIAHGVAGFGGLPAVALQLAGIAGLDKALNIVVSAVIARISFNAAGKSLRFGGAS